MSQPGSSHAGRLNRQDARAFKHWWTVRGHAVDVRTSGRRGVFDVYLRLNRETAT